MKVAIVGSRGLKVSDLGNYLPANVTEIVSRDAKWINPCAKEYTLSREIKLTEYLSEYEKYGKAAPLKRNITIIESVGFHSIWLAHLDEIPISFSIYAESRDSFFFLEVPYPIEVRILLQHASGMLKARPYSNTVGYSRKIKLRIFRLFSRKRSILRSFVLRLQNCPLPAKIDRKKVKKTE